LTLVALKSRASLDELWIYVLLGILATEALRYTSWVKLVHKACMARPVLAILVATVLGAASPLCTYGTVPVVAEIVASGVAIAPVVAFLAASSLMNPQLFVLTWGGISPEMAVARLGAVVAFGVFVGFVATRVPTAWIVNPALFNSTTSKPSARGPRVFSWRGFAQGCWKTLRFIGPYLVGGIVLGAVIEVFVPARWFLKGVTPGNWTGVLVAIAISVPLSACGGGAIPIVRSLLLQGMSRGSALAFFVAGPATRPSPILALAAVLRPAAVVLYITLLVMYALLSGLLYD
jgi:uncharacterized protein